MPWQLNVNIEKDLRSLACKEKAMSIKELLPWITDVTDLDKQHHDNQKRIAEAVNEQLQPSKCPYNPNHARSHKQSTATNTMSGNLNLTYPPKLTTRTQRVFQMPSILHWASGRRMCSNVEWKELQNTHHTGCPAVNLTSHVGGVYWSCNNYGSTKRTQQIHVLSQGSEWLLWEVLCT